MGDFSATSGLPCSGREPEGEGPASGTGAERGTGSETVVRAGVPIMTELSPSGMNSVAAPRRIDILIDRDWFAWVGVWWLWMTDAVLWLMQVEGT